MRRGAVERGGQHHFSAVLRTPRLHHAHAADRPRAGPGFPQLPHVEAVAIIFLPRLYGGSASREFARAREGDISLRQPDADKGELAAAADLEQHDLVTGFALRIELARNF